jgi:hypothetical protein
MQLSLAYLCTFLGSLILWQATPSTIEAKPNSLNFIQCPWELDGRQWKPYHYDSYPLAGIVKYLPNGDHPATWTELVTTQWYENTQQTPNEYFDVFIGDLERLFAEDILVGNVLNKTNLSLTGEWSKQKSDAENPELYGLIKIFSLYPHTYLLTYTTRNAKKIEQAKESWLPIIQETQLNYRSLERSE